MLHWKIVGVLLHTTAWDQLWGGDGFKLYRFSLALPISPFTFEAYLTTLFTNIFWLKLFLGDRAGYMDRQTFLGKFYLRYPLRQRVIHNLI